MSGCRGHRSAARWNGQREGSQDGEGCTDKHGSFTVVSYSGEGQPVEPGH